MVITDLLRRNARHHGAETALVFRDPAQGLRTQLSWSEFDSQARRLAVAFARRGIGKGDKVLLLLMNGLEWLPAYFGILRSGAWAVPLNFRFTSDTIGYCNSVAEAGAIIFGAEFIVQIEAVKAELDRTVRTYIFVGPQPLTPAFAEHYAEFIAVDAAEAPAVDLSPIDEAALYFTSGTTGRPKAVLLTQQNLFTACITERQHHQQRRDDIFLCIPPLYHTGSKMHWFGSLAAGAPAVLLQGVRPEWILRIISEERISIVFLLVPWIYDLLIALESGALQLKDFSLAHWRMMHMGAQPVPPALVRRWQVFFPEQEIDVSYGLTESTGPGCLNLGRGNLHKLGSIGTAGYNWECRIVDEDGAPLESGATGELLVRGPGTMKAYYRNPEETAKVLQSGWLHTGDIAHLDDDGFYWLVDRKKDVIVSGGENVYPFEVESFFLVWDKIRDVAVIGYPDPRLGEIVAAVIDVKPGVVLSEQDVDAYAQSLPRFQRPKRVFFGEVPRNPTGKIEKSRLRDRYCPPP